jgi:biotin-(acetyl-CoA carboxylase) ligase
LEAHGLSLSQAVAWGLWAGLVDTFPTLQPLLMLRGINDLYLNEAKLGGVLVESRGGGSEEGPHTLVIGFGLNVWQAPPTLADGRHVSTSLQAHVPANTLLPCPTLAVLLARRVHSTLALWKEGRLPTT